jgi:adenosine deaminase
MQEAIIYSLLHCHFESALRALTLAKPGRLQYVRAVYSSQAYRRAAPAEKLTLLWREVLSLTDNEDIFSELMFRQVVRRLLDEMRASRVEHIDLRIGPSIGRWRWMHSMTDGFDIFAEELTRYGHLSMAFLAGVNMTKSEDQLDVIFDMLFGDADVTDRIAGIDINFLPSDLPKFKRYLPSLHRLQTDGLKINIHLGELFDNEISRYVLSCITPDRIGHGVLLLQDKTLVEIIKHHGICLDMCPTSNTLLGVVNWNRESPAGHALRIGIPVSINTDDPVLFDTNIDREVRLAQLTDEQLEAVLADSRKYRYGGSESGASHLVRDSVCRQVNDGY